MHTKQTPQTPPPHHPGFTLIEMAVVIMVIGILIAMSVFGWGAWRTTTAKNVLKSDLTNAAAQLQSDLQWKNSYPATKEAANNGKGLPTSNGTTLQYTRTANNVYCLTATSATPNVPAFMISSDNKTPREGACVGHDEG